LAKFNSAETNPDGWQNTLPQQRLERLQLQTAFGDSKIGSVGNFSRIHQDFTPHQLHLAPIPGYAAVITAGPLATGERGMGPVVVRRRINDEVDE
jgi:hypothetical protein